MASADKKTAASQDALAQEGEYAARNRAMMDAMKLVRIRISCMNPAKRDLKGEIITVANSALNVRKYVAYGEKAKDGWHVPQCILDALREAKYVGVRQDENAKAPPVMELMPEYSIDVLPQLSQAELEQIALAQLQQ